MPTGNGIWATVAVAILLILAIVGRPRLISAPFVVAHIPKLKQSSCHNALRFSLAKRNTEGCSICGTSNPPCSKKRLQPCGCLLVVLSSTGYTFSDH